MEENKEVETITNEEQPTVQSVEPSNNDKKGNNKKLITIILIIAAGLCVVFAVVFFVFFNHSDKDDDYDNEPDVVEKEDEDRNEEEKNDKEERTYKYVSKYIIGKFDSNSYNFNEIKKASQSDTIRRLDGKTAKDIVYTFNIENGSVIISNNLNSKYTITKIKNAKELVAFNSIQSQSDSSLAVLTNDGKLYTIALENVNENGKDLVTDCTKLDSNVSEQKLDGSVNSIAFGSYIHKSETGGIAAVLITLNNNKQYILSPTSTHIVYNDADLVLEYQKADVNGLKDSSIKISNMFIFSNQFGFKTGKVTEMSNDQLIDMTMLYLEKDSRACFDKEYLNKKSKELFGVELKSNKLPSNVTFENNIYCQEHNWGSGGNTNPLTLSDSKVTKENGKVVYSNEYSYENNKTTITLEYKLENDHYVLVLVSKK